MEVIIQPEAEAAADLTARVIAAALRANPRLVLGLATGRTMESLYGMLARMHRRKSSTFRVCRTFNLDEYVGLPGDDPHSYRHYMDRISFHR